MAVFLSEGASKRMCSHDFCQKKEVLYPVLQVIDLKPISDRYRFLLSNGSHHLHGILINHSVHSGRLQQGSVVMLTNFFVAEILGYNLKHVIIHELDIVVEKNDLIGEPVPARNSLTWPFNQGDTSENSHAGAITASMKELSLDLTLNLPHNP